MTLSKNNQNIIEAVKKGYYIDVFGNAFSKNKQLKPHNYNNRKRNNIYLTFSINNPTGKIKIHRLQAYQKYGDKIFEEDICVRHLNGNSLDNSFDNISIGSPHDNMMDIPKEKRIIRGKKAASFLRIFTEEQIEEIRNMHNNGATYNLLKNLLGCAKSTISYIINKQTYK